MFSSLATKIALKRAGLSGDALNFANANPFSSPSSSSSREPNKLRKNPPSDAQRGSEWPDQDSSSSWGNLFSYRSLPLTAHAWLSPRPPPVAVGQLPRVGEVAPLDRDRRLEFGGGRRVLLVFLRCVGCAFAQKTFLNLRTIANRYRTSITCIAISHSSESATRKWIDLIGGAWNVQVVIDEDRAIYAAWGLGVANVWHLFNPTTQMQGWREKGWLGDKVAESLQRQNTDSVPTSKSRLEASAKATAGDRTSDEDDDGASTVLGNKWQEAGSFAIDGRGTVIWGGKALRADDLMDLEEGAKLLSL